jgi:hypothetical protein
MGVMGRTDWRRDEENGLVVERGSWMMWMRDVGDLMGNLLGQFVFVV